MGAAGAKTNLIDFLASARLRWRPFPGSSCDGDEEYHFDEAPEEVVDPRFADAQPDDGDQEDEADDDVDDLRKERQAQVMRIEETANHETDSDG